MFLQRWRDSRHWPVLRFALVGLAACAIATLIAEILVQSLNPETPPGQDVPMSVALLIDVSSSMAGEPVEEVKQAATSFLRSWDRSDMAIRLIPFPSRGSDQLPVLEPGQDPEPMISWISRLEAGGSTPTANALTRAGRFFDSRPSGRNAVMLFTDGFPNNAAAARSRARQLRNSGVVVVAVGTDDSLQSFLLEVVGHDPEKVFTTQLGDFASAFSEAVKVIEASAFGTASRTQGLVLVAVVALFLSMALLIADNLWGMRGRWWRDIWWIPIGSMTLGVAGGAIGEYFLRAGPLTWALVGLSCGAALGLTDLAGQDRRSGGIARFLTRKSRRGAIFGLMGGIVGGLVFGILFSQGGSSPHSSLALLSRVIGFTFVGFFIGLAIRLGEELFKEAWLTGITKGPFEGGQYILSKPVVAIGNGGRNDLILNRETDIGETAGYMELVDKTWHFSPAADSADIAVNGLPVRDRMALADAATLKFGETEFLFRQRAKAGEAARERDWMLVGDHESFPLPMQDRVSVGSDPTCDIVLDDPSVDGLHFHLEFQDEGLSVSPTKGSSVQVNDEEWKSGAIVLEPGDLLTVGTLDLALTTDRGD